MDVSLLTIASAVTFLYDQEMGTQLDMKNLDTNERSLISKLFSKDLNSYDSSQPSHKPMPVDITMVIDHIRDLDQKAHTVSLSATLLLRWNDSRIEWESKDYGNVTKIVRMKRDLPRMWFPDINVYQLNHRWKSVLRSYNARIGFTKQGMVVAQVALSVQSSCSFRFAAYPYDSQICIISIFTSEYNDVLDFQTAYAQVGTDAMFESGTLSSSALETSEFTLSEASSAIITFHYQIGSESMVRVSLKFNRMAAYYMITIGLPLFCISAVTYLVATIQDARFSLLWLMVCAAAQFVNYTQMLNKMPPNPESNPRCVQMATLVLAETTALFLYRSVAGYVRLRFTDRAVWKRILLVAEISLKVILLMHLVLNAYVIFFQ